MAAIMRSGRPRACPPGLAGQRGYGYAFALLAVLLLGIYLAKVGEAWSSQQRRAREAVLLQQGDEIRRAVASYVAATQEGQPRYPKSLAELVQDERGTVLRRHLRRAYRDPITGLDWAYIDAPGGGFLGVYSKSLARPLKQAGFRPPYRGFADQRTYQAWRFAAWPNSRGLGR